MRTRNNEIIDINATSDRPLRNEQGIPLDDNDFILYSIDMIDKYERENNAAAPIQPTFKQWLKDASEAIKNGEDIVDFKNKTIVRTIPDFSILKGVN